MPEQPNKIFYLCNGEVPECEKTNCYKRKKDGFCRHTSNVEYAINFEKNKGASGNYMEKENDRR